MKTELLKIDPENIDNDLINYAAKKLTDGALVVFPTETVYGLGADAMQPKSVRAIFTAKGRAADNPLIAHVADIDGALAIVRDVPKSAKALMEHFWGGPLTLILKRRDFINDVVTASLDTVAVRLPSHSVAHALLCAAKTPVAAPSANLSGSPSPTTAEDCLRDLDGRVDVIIDGGASPIGIESTVIDMTAEVPTVLRPGAVTLEMLRGAIGEVRYGAESSDAPKCPGMKYTHYSPKAEVFAVRDMKAFLKEHTLLKDEGVISLSPERTEQNFFDAGSDYSSYAARLFYLLRRCDDNKINTVYALLPEDTGIGTALRNRLIKSAGGRIL